MRMPGPFFGEDLYSLPSKAPEREDALARIAADICAALGLRNALFNVELRQNRAGEFKVVEFSPRISGGHIYRNVRDVYSLDLVAATSRPASPSWRRCATTSCAARRRA